VITQDYLKQLFEYKDGNLYWKQNTGRARIGNVAGHKRTTGYVMIKINKKDFLAHRVIFMMHKGYFPKLIDHIDGNPSNNKIENLREASHSENGHNAKLNKNNSIKLKHICLNKRKDKWQVQMFIDNKNKSFGEYYDLEVAKFVAETMRHKYHGQFARSI